ncbi:capsular polysaccharide biosynthesis protein [Pullulanibacillus pueri]|uniref:Capsular polysaccharide biosynthesis protein n=1 Tax=Pullulanibacillus pueri TaxID=1437324 RepID=A0A8J3EMR6_9BACL|nr:Wzz/FepE/Etk N-terminal domain-containing protein [Pullulanibacillus pueri]MBM7681773.1 capsular polysaccharide biosynthesis protein [Pullulanibacillus pueri]GGH84200.1 capsular polysaccharide biosynthesis protein [Pullulanibacillus pueri]
MEETISLREIFQTLRKRLVMIIIITLAATAVSALVTYLFITPKYEASTQILVNQSSKDSQSLYQNNQIDTNIKLINTYTDIIKSPSILDEVVNKFNISEADIKNSLNVSNGQDSQVFTLSLQNTDPALAVKIVNDVANVFKNKVQTLMDVDNVSILSKANLSDHPSPVSPNPKLNMAIAFVVGLMISVGLAFLFEFLDNTIKTEADIEKALELPVLGAVVSMEESDVRSAKKASQKVRSGSIEA